MTYESLARDIYSILNPTDDARLYMEDIFIALDEVIPVVRNQFIEQKRYRGFISQTNLSGFSASSQYPFLYEKDLPTDLDDGLGERAVVHCFNKSDESSSLDASGTVGDYAYDEGTDGIYIYERVTNGGIVTFDPKNIVTFREQDGFKYAAGQAFNLSGVYYVFNVDVDNTDNTLNALIQADYISQAYWKKKKPAYREMYRMRFNDFSPARMLDWTDDMVAFYGVNPEQNKFYVSRNVNSCFIYYIKKWSRPSMKTDLDFPDEMYTMIETMTLQKLDHKTGNRSADNRVKVVKND